MMLIRFFTDNFPSLPQLISGGTLSLLWAFFALYTAGKLKQQFHLKTGYTRKIFHFTIFISAAIIDALSGLPAVCLFGAMTSLVVLTAILFGDGHLLYEAIAREKDAPKRTYFIIAPYFATLIGGIASNLFFAPTAIAGYLAAGIGDAIAEPVGVRFGRHSYTAPSFSGVRTSRSLEGSAAVLISTSLFIGIWIGFSAEGGLDGTKIASCLLIGTLAALVEAISPHGWDNAMMQIVPSMLAAWLF